jgi:hypothetical protein
MVRHLSPGDHKTLFHMHNKYNNICPVYFKKANRGGYGRNYKGF